LEQFPDTPPDLPLITIQRIWEGDETSFAFIRDLAVELLIAKGGAQWKPIMGGHMKNVDIQMAALLTRLMIATATLQGITHPGFTPVTLIKLFEDQVCFHF
jgi:hypothetical protein